MANIETIEIRVSPNRSKVLEDEIAEFVATASNKKDEFSIKLYNKAWLKSDYLIVIYYEKPKTGKLKPGLGERLITELKEYGMVYHNCWDELM